MLGHLRTKAAAAHLLSRVHRLQLGVVPVEFFERTDRDERSIHSQTEERHPGIEEAIDVQSVDVLAGTVCVGKGEVPFQNGAYLRRTRILDRDRAVRHRDFSRRPTP